MVELVAENQRKVVLLRFFGFAHHKHFHVLIDIFISMTAMKFSSIT